MDNVKNQNNKLYNKIGLIFFTIIISVICFRTPIGILASVGVSILLLCVAYVNIKKKRDMYNKIKYDKGFEKSNLKFVPKTILSVLCCLLVLYIFWISFLRYFVAISIIPFSLIKALAPEIFLIIPLTYFMFQNILLLIIIYNKNLQLKEDNKTKLTSMYKYLNENKKAIILTISITFICLIPTIYSDLSFKTIDNTIVLYRNIFNGNVVVPKRITTIGESAFKSNASYSINNIYSIDMTNVEKISKNAFYNQERLTQVNFSDNLEIIGENAFSFCGLEEINLPDSLKVIEDRAFFNNRFKNVTIPNGVTYIGKGAFGGWYVDIKTITIPDSVEYISDELFTTLHDDGNKLRTTNEMFIPEESPLVLVKQGSYAESICIKNGWNFDYY